MIKNLTPHDKKLDDVFNDFQSSKNDPYHFLFNLTANNYQYILDLKIGLLKSNEDNIFIIGEHPVVVLNPYLCLKNWPNSKQGIAVKGTIILMPISPTYVLILYDELRYKLINLKKIVELQKNDIEIINYCQFLQTEDCIYFNRNVMEENFHEKNKLSEKYRKEIKSSLETYPEVNKKRKGYTSELLVMGSPDLPIKQNFQFIGILEKALKANLGPTLDIRRESLKCYEYTSY